MTWDLYTRIVGKANSATLHVELSTTGQQLRIRREGGCQVMVDLAEAHQLAEVLVRADADLVRDDLGATGGLEEMIDDDTCPKCGERTLVAHPTVEGEAVCPDCDE